MRHASLFSGIGGFDLAAHWMGWDNVFQVENDKACNRRLELRFPSVKRYTNIQDFNGKEYKGAVDVLSGGFPCQPFSIAGLRAGTSDPRHLWPEMLRVIREVEPQYVVAENVRGLLSWQDGMVLEQVCSDLEASGYSIQTYLLPACSLNASHYRYRIWIIGERHTFLHATHANGDGVKPRRPDEDCESENQSETQEKQWQRVRDDLRRASQQWEVDPNDDALVRDHGKPNDTYSYHTRCKQQWATQKSVKQGQYTGITPPVRLLGLPTQSPICGRANGLPNRMDRLKQLGNAIVPQQALAIFRAIQLTHNQLT